MSIPTVEFGLGHLGPTWCRAFLPNPSEPAAGPIEHARDPPVPEYRSPSTEMALDGCAKNGGDSQKRRAVRLTIHDSS
jgi:hypothetical protein